MDAYETEDMNQGGRAGGSGGGDGIARSKTRPTPTHTVISGVSNAGLRPPGHVPCMQPPVPVTLVTGFLGAGKSSLVAHVLHNKQGRRVAVVVNEFGAGLGLESALVPDGDRCSRNVGSSGTAVMLTRASARSDTLVEEFVELPNGCICCTVKDRCAKGAATECRAGAHASAAFCRRWKRCWRSASGWTAS